MSMKITQNRVDIVLACAPGRDTLISRLTDDNMISLMNTVYTPEKFLDAANWTDEEYSKYSEICQHALDNMA